MEIPVSYPDQTSTEWPRPVLTGHVVQFVNDYKGLCGVVIKPDGSIASVKVEELTVTGQT